MGESVASRENCVAEAQRRVAMSYLRMGRGQIWLKHGRKVVKHKAGKLFEACQEGREYLHGGLS